MKRINCVALIVILSAAATIAAHSQDPDHRKVIARRAVFGDLDHSLAIPRAEGAAGQKDPAAVAAIERFLLVTGAAQWTGFSGSGSIAVGRDEQARRGNAEISVGANNWERLDIHYSSGTRSIRIMGPVGAVQQEDGAMLSLPAQTATVGIVTLPITLSSLLGDESASIIDDGITVVEGAHLHKVTVVRRLQNSSASPTSLLQPIASTLLFDPGSGFLRKSADVIVYTGAMNTKHLRVLTYDEYRSSDGIALPYRLTETVDGLPSWTLALSSASVNSSHQSTYFQF